MSAQRQPTPLRPRTPLEQRRPTRDDQLVPARGVLNGLRFSAPFWVAAVLLLWWAVGK